MCVCVCVCVCVCARVCVCMCVCVRACVRAHMHASVCACGCQPALFHALCDHIIRSVVPGQRGTHSPKHSLKVIKATMTKSGKKYTFEKGEVGYVDITEDNANIDYISQEVGALWGSEYRITTADGAEVKDCSGTRGDYCAYI